MWTFSAYKKWERNSVVRGDGACEVFKPEGGEQNIKLPWGWVVGPGTHSSREVGRKPSGLDLPFSCTHLHLFTLLPQLPQHTSSSVSTLSTWPWVVNICLRISFYCKHLDQLAILTFYQIQFGFLLMCSCDSALLCSLKILILGVGKRKL